MKKELASSALKLFEFICRHSDATGRIWYSKLPATTTLQEDSRVLVGLKLIDIRSDNSYPAFIRLTNKGTDFAREDGLIK